MSATANLHKKRADVEAKCAKLIQHCFQVDKLSQDLTSFIDTFFEILQSDFMTYNKDGGKLIDKIFDDFLQELMQCFVTKQFRKSKWLIKEVKQLKYLAKSVAETSLSEAMLVLEKYGRIINNLTLVVTLSKTTVEDALLRYPEDEDLLTISEQANAYDHPDYPLIGVTNRTQGYGKKMMERECYLIKTPTDLMIIMATNIESLTKFTRRFIKPRILS
ncbi:MAG: hypothetical protein JW384_03305 [Nitrosomonadaceae bacterium]|nr:hypothetical protein [Nitrosomonadaceae bacterium]